MRFVSIQQAQTISPSCSTLNHTLLILTTVPHLASSFSGWCRVRCASLRPMGQTVACESRQMEVWFDWEWRMVCGNILKHVSIVVLYYLYLNICFHMYKAIIGYLANGRCNKHSRCNSMKSSDFTICSNIHIDDVTTGAWFFSIGVVRSSNRHLHGHGLKMLQQMLLVAILKCKDFGSFKANHPKSMLKEGWTHSTIYCFETAT